MLVLPPSGPAQRTFELGACTRIGRHPSCQVQLLDKLVSKVHCEIVARDGNHFIRDLATTNGTWVNGVRLVGERRLEHLDEISASRVRLLFVDPESAIRRSPTGNPYRKAARVSSKPPAPPVETGDLASLRRFYALVRMLSTETDRKQLATDAAHGLLSLCEADWAVLCARQSDAMYVELARAARDKSPKLPATLLDLFGVAATARAPTFQLGRDRVLQLVIPLIHAGEVRGVFWLGMSTPAATPPVIELLGTYATFVAVALAALEVR